MTPWYEALFANYGRTYDKEPYTQGTVGEVDFVELELGADRSKRILDIGCGTGRHAIELARRGYRVTGFDLSEAQLRRAREKAAAAGVAVEFQRRDATQPHFDRQFDAAIMFCEGAFSLMETDEENHAILRHAAAALRPGGKLLLTTLNALFPLFHSVKDFLQSGGSGAAIDKLTFDWMTFRERVELTFTDDAGQTQTIATNERYYTPPEMRWLLKTAGFAKVDIFGCHLGQFSRADALTRDDFEMLVVAERGGDDAKGSEVDSGHLMIAPPSAVGRENETWTPGRIAWQWPAPSCPLRTADPAEHFDQWPPIRPRSAVAAPTSTSPLGPPLASR